MRACDDDACPFCRGTVIEAAGPRGTRFILCVLCMARGPQASTTAIAWARWRGDFT